jgi:two-component system sensor histidine kinase ChvG
VHDAQGEIVADTRLLKGEIDRKDLPEIRDPTGSSRRGWTRCAASPARSKARHRPPGRSPRLARSKQEIAMALVASAGFSERFNERGRARALRHRADHARSRASSAASPSRPTTSPRSSQHERAALVPLILVAVLVAFITATLLTLGIARPLRKLAIASDRVAAGATERLDLGALHDRKDEIGDLALAMEAMTTSAL